ncbi:uncharacterized protein LOC108838482 [Raphanus sativus]|uniref:Uncharacterized protein LOC108838482 n=1 Tax=Raphanus sativus TaxID=3726 RepID=A0A9W3D8Q9_RAPSA|nr:uncharacterized protein LOC108838482 [Raphanus sativus]
MSQLLSRLSRLSSSSSHGLTELRRRLSTAATPYLLSKETISKKAKRPFDGSFLVDMNLYDPTRVSLTLTTSPRADKMRCYELFPGERVESQKKTPPSGNSSYRKKPKSFRVFRQDPERKISSYTEDIGDLCIFVGGSESFCVSATEYPGLKPNSVYYAGYSTGFGFYDLSSNTLHDLTHEAVASSEYMWLAPLQ